MNRLKRYFSLELYFWIIALLSLYFITPSVSDFSFCVFNHLGISWCPGCGIGRSISYLLHGEILKSIETHKLGTIALAVIVYRIAQLIFHLYKTNQNHVKSIYPF